MKYIIIALLALSFNVSADSKTIGQATGMLGTTFHVSLSTGRSNYVHVYVIGKHRIRKVSGGLDVYDLRQLIKVLEKGLVELEAVD